MCHDKEGEDLFVCANSPFVALPLEGILSLTLSPSLLSSNQMSHSA